MQCWCSARFRFVGAVPLAELISTQLLKGAEMPLEDLYAPRTQRLLEFSWNGEWSNWKESKWIQENWQTLHCFVVSCDKGVVVQSILIFDLQFMCSHVLFRTRWLVFSWFIVVQEGSSSHVLLFLHCLGYFSSPGSLFGPSTNEHPFKTQLFYTFLASLLDSEGFWQTIDSDRLR